MPATDANEEDSQPGSNPRGFCWAVLGPLHKEEKRDKPEEDVAGRPGPSNSSGSAAPQSRGSRGYAAQGGLIGTRGSR